MKSHQDATHGLNIHLASMKCREQENILQRTGSNPGETQEEPDPESPHRAQSLQAVEPSNPCKIVQQKRIKWPPAKSQSVWSQFDTDVSKILETTSRGEVDRRLETMTAVIVSYAAERFGHIESSNLKSSYTMNRRANQINKLRQELRSLKQQHKVASEDEKQPLVELRNILRKKLMTLRRAEWHRRRGKERARKRTAFISKPFTFTKKLLGDKHSGS